MQREKIEFPTNTPVLIKLDWDEGTLKPGKFGDEYQYVCDDDTRIMWVKPELHALIGQSGVRSGDEIAVTKREVKEGNRRRVQWEVQKVEDEPAPVADLRPAAPPSAPKPQPLPQAAPAAAPVPARSTPISQPPARSDAQLANPLTAALLLAVDAAMEAERYANQAGYSLRLGTEDVRALAITAFIQGQGGRR